MLGLCEFKIFLVVKICILVKFGCKHMNYNDMFNIQKLKEWCIDWIWIGFNVLFILQYSKTQGYLLHISLPKILEAQQRLATGL